MPDVLPVDHTSDSDMAYEDNANNDVLQAAITRLGPPISDHSPLWGVRQKETLIKLAALAARVRQGELRVAPSIETGGDPQRFLAMLTEANFDGDASVSDVIDTLRVRKNRLLDIHDQLDAYARHAIGAFDASPDDLLRCLCLLEVLPQFGNTPVERIASIRLADHVSAADLDAAWDRRQLLKMADEEIANSIGVSPLRMAPTAFHGIRRAVAAGDAKKLHTAILLLWGDDVVHHEGTLNNFVQFLEAYDAYSNDRSSMLVDHAGATIFHGFLRLRAELKLAAIRFGANWDDLDRSFRPAPHAVEADLLALRGFPDEPLKSWLHETVLRRRSVEDGEERSTVATTLADVEREIERSGEIERALGGVGNSTSDLTIRRITEELSGSSLAKALQDEGIDLPAGAWVDDIDHHMQWIDDTDLLPADDEYVERFVANHGRNPLPVDPVTGPQEVEEASGIDMQNAETREAIEEAGEIPAEHRVERHDPEQGQHGQSEWNVPDVGLNIEPEIPAEEAHDDHVVERSEDDHPVHTDDAEVVVHQEPPHEDHSIAQVDVEEIEQEDADENDAAPAHPDEDGRSWAVDDHHVAHTTAEVGDTEIARIVDIPHTADGVQELVHASLQKRDFRTLFAIEGRSIANREANGPLKSEPGMFKGLMEGFDGIAIGQDAIWANDVRDLLELDLSHVEKPVSPETIEFTVLKFYGGRHDMTAVQQPREHIPFDKSTWAVHQDTVLMASERLDDWAKKGTDLSVLAKIVAAQTDSDLGHNTAPLPDGARSPDGLVMNDLSEAVMRLVVSAATGKFVPTELRNKTGLNSFEVTGALDLLVRAAPELMAFCIAFVRASVRDFDMSEAAIRERLLATQNTSDTTGD